MFSRRFEDDKDNLPKLNHGFWTQRFVMYSWRKEWKRVILRSENPLSGTRPSLQSLYSLLEWLTGVFILTAMTVIAASRNSSDKEIMRCKMIGKAAYASARNKTFFKQNKLFFKRKAGRRHGISRLMVCMIHWCEFFRELFSRVDSNTWYFVLVEFAAMKAFTVYSYTARWMFLLKQMFPDLPSDNQKTELFTVRCRALGLLFTGWTRVPVSWLHYV